MISKASVKSLGIGDWVVNRGHVVAIDYHRPYDSWCCGRVRCDRAITVAFDTGNLVSWASDAMVQVYEPEGSPCTCGGNTLNTNMCGNCGGHIQ
jgi:hypothetical protein